MQVYVADEISAEYSTYDIPNQLAATGPESVNGLIGDPECALAHLVGAIEGFIMGRMDRDFVEGMLDDEEYPAKRIIETLPDGTVMMDARFGRNKRWVMAFNKAHEETALRRVEEWIDSVQ